MLLGQFPKKIFLVPQSNPEENFQKNILEEIQHFN